MGDRSFRKVQQGDRIRFPTDMWNAMIDAATLAKAAKERPRDLAAKIVQPCIVMIKNDSGGDLEKNHIIGLDDILITPTDEIDLFRDIPMFVGDAPAVALHLGNFAILLEPIQDGDIGRAIVSGVVQVQINVTNAAHQFADVKDGDATQLQSYASGSAQILYKESGTGTKWALVRMGNLPAERVCTLTGYSVISDTERTYSGTDEFGNTLTGIRNGFEPADGSPGPLGINVDEDGFIDDSECMLKPIGPARVFIRPDPDNPGYWMFSHPLSSQ